jgi:hypothetical protein
MTFTRSALVLAVAATGSAAVGWTRNPAPSQPRPSVRIVDVQPLSTTDAALRDVITHTFAVRVRIRGWKLLPYVPGARGPGRHRAGHWRLFLDGRSLGTNYGAERVTYTGYLPPGTHWIAAELTDAAGASVGPALWSEPVVLHVPRVVRCRQSGWRGSPETGTPTFTCAARGAAAATS